MLNLKIEDPHATTQSSPKKRSKIGKNLANPPLGAGKGGEAGHVGTSENKSGYSTPRRGKLSMPGLER